MLQFVRETPIRIVLKKALLEKQGFLFYVAAGFSKDIDPQSGMSVNLVLVDQWLADLKMFLEFTEQEGNFLEVAKEFLDKKANTDGAVLQSLTFREERGKKVSWSRNFAPGSFEVSHSYLKDLFFKEGYGLYEITLCWSSTVGLWPSVSSEDGKIVEEIAKQASTMSETALQVWLQKISAPVLPGLKLRSIEVLNCATRSSWCLFV